MKRDVIYAFSDLHLTNKNSKFKTKSGVSDLLRAQRDFCTDLGLQARQEEDLSHVVFCGDWSDYTNFDPVMQQFSNICFSQVCDNDAANLFVTGNHTVYGSQNAFSVLNAKSSLYQEAEVFDRTTDYTDVVNGDHEFDFFMVPYQESYDEIVSSIRHRNEKIDNSDKVNILFFHFPTMGAKLDNKVLSKSGVPVKPEHVNNFDLCIGGDYHRPQEVFEGFHYIGAPFSLKFGENDCPRGFLKIIIEDGDISFERVQNHRNYEMLRVEGFDGFEQLRSEERDWRRMILKVEGDISERQRTQLQKVEGEFYRLILPPIGANSGDDEQDERVDVSKMEVFEENDDVEQVKQNIDSRELPSDLKGEAVELFTEEILS